MAEAPSELDVVIPSSPERIAPLLRQSDPDLVRARMALSLRSGKPHGALTELGGETVRVLRVGREERAGGEKSCADGTLWIMETEPE